jgi:hypothetical protein
MKKQLLETKSKYKRQRTGSSSFTMVRSDDRPLFRDNCVQVAFFLCNFK